MSIEGWASINGHQYYNMIFIKDIRMICLRYYLYIGTGWEACATSAVSVRCNPGLGYFGRFRLT